MKGYRESAYDSVADLLFRAQAILDRTQQEQKRAPTQGPGNQCASQVAVTWRSYDERKVTLTKTYVPPDRDCSDRSQPRGGAEIS